MAGQGRSARTRQQRLQRRRQETRGYDEGGARRPFYRHRWFKPVIAIGVVGILASLIGGSLFILTGTGNPHGGTDASAGTAPVPIARISTDDDPAADPDAAADGSDKPQFDAPPAFALAPDTDYQAVLVLESGSVRIDLFEDLAPIHVNNFVFLAEQGFFDGLTFHRVLQNFVAQAGDPTATGFGGAGYVLPDEEIDPALTLGNHGVIAMARGPDGASSSQFFFTLAPQQQLDNLNFTAFGAITEGLELVQALPLRDPAETPTPPPGAQIVSITIEQAPRTAAGGG